MRVEAGEIEFQLDEYADEDQAIGAATSLRGRHGYATQYNEPITLSVIIVTAAITAVFDYMVPKILSWRADRARKKKSEQESAREEQFQKDIIREMRNQTKILLDLGAKLEDRDRVQTSAAAVANVLNAVGVKQVILSPETASEAELIAEMSRFSGGRIQAKSSAPAAPGGSPPRAGQPAGPGGGQSPASRPA
jgi:hypothetical protein